MSQIPAVNLVNPVQGSEGNIATFSGNQVAKAEIAARERLQKAQIEAESLMQKARLDAGAKESEANRQAQSADYQRLNEARAREADADRMQQQAQFDAKIAFEKEQADKLTRLEETRAQRKAELEARLLEIEAATLGAAEQDSLKSDAEVDAALAELERLRVEEAGVMTQLERETRQGEGRGRMLAEELQRRHAGVLQVKQEGMTAVEAAIGTVLQEAQADMPTFWNKVWSAGVGPAIGGMLGGAAAEAMQPGSEVVGGGGLSPQNAAAVMNNPMFNAQVFGRALMERLAMTMPVVEGADPAMAQQAVMGLVDAALGVGQSGSMEQLDQALTQASQFVSADWLLGVATAMKTPSGNMLKYMEGLRQGGGATPNKQERDAAKRTADALARVGRNIETRIKSLDLDDQSEAMSKAIDLYVTSYGLTGTVDQFMQVAKEFGVDSSEKMRAMFQRLEGSLGKEQIGKLKELERRIQGERRQLDLGIIRSDRRSQRALTGASREAKTQQAQALRDIVFER